MDARQISRGLLNKYMNDQLKEKNFTGQDPKWREYASVAYFRNKLYYLGGDINRVNVRKLNESPL